MRLVGPPPVVVTLPESSARRREAGRHKATKRPRGEVKGRHWFGGAEARRVRGWPWRSPIMFCLAFATVLTLVVVPVLYAAFYRVPSLSPA